MAPQAEIVATNAFAHIERGIFGEAPIGEEQKSLWGKLEQASQVANLEKANELLAKLQKLQQTAEAIAQYETLAGGFIAMLRTLGVADRKIPDLIPAKVPKRLKGSIPIERKITRRGPDIYRPDIPDVNLFILEKIFEQTAEGEFAYPNGKSIAKLILQEGLRGDEEKLALAVDHIWDLKKSFIGNIKEKAQEIRGEKPLEMTKEGFPAETMSSVINRILPQITNPNRRKFYEDLSNRFGTLSPKEFIKQADFRYRGRRKPREITGLKNPEEVVVISPACETVLGSRFREEGVLEQLQQLIGVPNLAGFSQEKGLFLGLGLPDVRGVLIVSWNQSAAERGNKPLTPEENKEAMEIIGKILKGTPSEVNPYYLNFRFFSALAEELKGNELKIRDLMGILFPSVEVKVGGDGLVVGLNN